MHYLKTGEGPAVVLIHGYCENAEVWRKLKPILPGGFTWLIPDLDSNGSENTEISMENYAEAILQMIEKEHFTKATIIGHSMGGYIALEFARNHTDYLAGLCIFSSHPFGDTDVKKEGRYKSIDFIQRNGTAKYIPEFVTNLFAEGTSKEVIDEQFKTIINTPVEVLIGCLMAMAKRKPAMDILADLKIPVLFLFGRKDKVMPLGDMMKQTTISSISEVAILENSGHSGMVEEPEKVVFYFHKYLSETLPFLRPKP